ncbi:hypothetical protein DFH07DRAFT_963506 [Mycena maculata]|uniref:Uncharacterized protein n=1 Tax=Mycena maculata TaxID=230809 RepID=A0AAD7N3M1_9AGAR|nr:hypothetical protein DFH07DRAFT_963506 [Mycena maculata]
MTPVANQKLLKSLDALTTKVKAFLSERTHPHRIRGAFLAKLDDLEQQRRPNTQDNARARAVEEWLAEILRDCQQLPLTLAEYIEYLQSESDGVRSSLEDAVLQEILPMSVANLQHKLDVRKMCETEHPDKILHLLVIHEALCAEAVAAPTQLLATRAAENVLTLHFAVIWEGAQEDDEDGSVHHSFYIQAFQSTRPGLFQGLTAAEKAKKMRSIQTEYEGWRRREEKTVTARSTLLRMYRFFGPALLMDPYWGIRSLSVRSKLLSCLLGKLLEDMPIDTNNKDGLPMASSWYSDSSYAFACAIEAADTKGAGWMREWRILNPDWVPDRADCLMDFE